jgi:hypothetical protein
MEHFRKTDYGWTCKHCEARRTPTAQAAGGRARFFTEGEAEEREPRLASPALARWRDSAHTTLLCTRCGIEEIIDGA